MSGMSPADQQMARMFRNAPGIARQMQGAQQDRERQDFQRQMQEDRQREMEQMLKARQTASDEAKAAAGQAKKAELDNALAEAKNSGTTGFLNPKFAPPGAQRMGFKVPPLPFGMGGQQAQGPAQVTSMPDKA